jgi:ADP-ribose pyrophosphatase
VTQYNQRFEALFSRLIHEDRWVRIHHDIIRRPSGDEGSYTVIEKRDFAVIAAIENGLIHLVRQYRYPVKASYWEMPQGSYEGPGVISAQEIASAELRQETGLVAQQIQILGSFFSAYGYSNQKCHLFLATGLSHVGQSLDAEEEGLETRPFTLPIFADMIRNGEIADGTTIAAVGLMKLNGIL